MNQASRVSLFLGNGAASRRASGSPPGGDRFVLPRVSVRIVSWLHVDPSLVPTGKRMLGGELQTVGINRFLNRVGCGVYRDLNLLVPKLRLARADLVMQLGRLVTQLQVLLTELKKNQTRRGGSEKANKKLKHDC